MKTNAMGIGSLVAMCTLLSALGCAVETADADPEANETHVTDEVAHRPVAEVAILHAPPPSEGELGVPGDMGDGREPELTNPAHAPAGEGTPEPFVHAPPPSEGEVGAPDLERGDMTGANHAPRVD